MIEFIKGFAHIKNRERELKKELGLIQFKQQAGQQIDWSNFEFDSIEEYKDALDI